MKCPYRMTVVRQGSPPIAGFQNRVESRIEWPECFKTECPFYDPKEGSDGVLREICEAAASRIPMPGTLPKYASSSKN